MNQLGIAPKPYSIRRGLQFLPLAATVLYLVLTMWMTQFRHGALLIENPLKLQIFLLLVLLSILGGFSFGSLSKLKTRKVVLDKTFVHQRLNIAIVKLGSLWYLAYALVGLTRLGISTPSALIIAVLDPSGSYSAKFEAFDAHGGLLGQILNLTGGLYFLTIPLGVIYWKKISRAVRCFFVLSVLSYVLFYLAAGTQRGVADIALLFGLSILANAAHSRATQSGSKSPRMSPKVKLSIGALAVVVTFVIMWSFGLRTAGSATYADLTVDGLRGTFGETLTRGFVVLSSYASQGYYGLALALTLPFEWAGLLSAAPGLASYLPQYFGVENPVLNSYPTRVELAYGWSSTVNWSTIFPWVASVIGFPLTIVAAGLVAFVFAKVWNRFLLTRSPSSLVCIGLISLLIFYIPANNQLFVDRFSAIGTVTLLLGAIFLRLHSVLSSKRRSQSFV